MLSFYAYVVAYDSFPKTRFKKKEKNHKILPYLHYRNWIVISALWNVLYQQIFANTLTYKYVFLQVKSFCTVANVWLHSWFWNMLCYSYLFRYLWLNYRWTQFVKLKGACSTSPVCQNVVDSFRRIIKYQLRQSKFLFFSLSWVF